MKKNYLLFVNVALAAISFSSCSNESSCVLMEKDSTINSQLSVDYSALLANRKPYISSGMQALINKLDTVTTVLPIEELMPGIETLFFKDTISVNRGEVTRTVSSEVLTGYYSKSFLFRNKAVSITNSNSSFKESLNCTLNMSGTVYLSAIAVCQYAIYAEPISLFRKAPQESDMIGIDPDSFNPDGITNDTYFSLGYSVEELSPGEFYYLTTYIFVISDSNDIYLGYLLPYISAAYTYQFRMDYYCESLQWRCFVTR